MTRTILMFLGFLLLAPSVQAQWIPCGAGGEGCEEHIYGLGNDNPDGPITTTVSHAVAGPGDGSCGPEQLFRFQGQVTIREQTECVVSASNRCMVEIPGVENESGYFNVNRGEFDLGPLGILAAIGGIFNDFAYNIGHRQLLGTCTTSKTSRYE